MSEKILRRRLHSKYERNWRYETQNKALHEADVLETPSAEEEETNLRGDQPTVMNSFFNDHLSVHSVSVDSDTDSESEILKNESNNNCSDNEVDENDCYFEDFMDEMEMHNNNRTNPLYAGSPISVHDACVRLIRKIYRQMPSNKNQCNITIILHADGAPAVNVNNKSLWPIQATIAEIPVPLRDWKSAVMVFGAWLASTKPPRDSLLILIIIQLQALVNSKILLKQKDGSRVSYNVRVQQAIFDLPARAHFLNAVQYNGYDGCGDCCIKGVAIGRQIYFPFSEKTEEPKNHQFYLKNSKHNAHRSIQGIKGPTPLSSILQLPNQTPYDSMHLIYHGHVNALLKFWRNIFASGYKHNRNSGKHVISDDDDEIEEEETIYVTRGRSNTDCSKNTDDSPAASLVIDEHSSNDHNTQENRTNVLSNVNGKLSDISERISERDDDDDDDDDDLVLPQSRPKQSTSNEALVTEVSNIHKEFLSFRYNIEKRIKSLEKIFRILKNRKVLKERNDLMNIDDSPLPLKAPDPEVVLGIDASKFRFGFDEHTKFVRQIFRQARYASDPNLVLSNENMVIEIQNALKKRDKRLQSDDAYFKDTWQIVKESLRQLKHDHKRNSEYKTF
ncbi:unnamed protein product [Rotaria magnacalcarata]